MTGSAVTGSVTTGRGAAGSSPPLAAAVESPFALDAEPLPHAATTTIAAIRERERTTRWVMVGRATLNEALRYDTCHVVPQATEPGGNRNYRG